MQIFINGIISGSAIALLAIAFQVVYLPTRIFFIGLAGIYSIAPFLAHVVLSNGGGMLLASVVATVVSMLVCIVCEYANHAPLSRRQASDGAQLISSLGIYIVIVQIIAMIWGNDTKTLRTGLDSVIHMGSVVITGAQWLILGIAVTLLLGFALFLSFSNIGLRMRALADNPAQFGLYGYNVDYHRLLAFSLAGLFASASSLVTAYDIGFDPYNGLNAVLLAVVAVMVGGRGSFVGPVIGALLLGILRALVVWNWSARWQESVTFALLAVVVMLRPEGLIRKQTRIEAQA